jgi:hypothetical protein
LAPKQPKEKGGKGREMMIFEIRFVNAGAEERTRSGEGGEEHDEETTTGPPRKPLSNAKGLHARLLLFTPTHMLRTATAGAAVAARDEQDGCDTGQVVADTRRSTRKKPLKAANMLEKMSNTLYYTLWVVCHCAAYVIGLSCTFPPSQLTLPLHLMGACVLCVCVCVRERE